MADLNGSAVRARVAHSRNAPARNAFRYDVDYVLLPEARLQEGRATRLLGLGPFALVSVAPKDHGFESAGGAAWVRELAAEAGVAGFDRIELLTHPRCWGYAFNPISVWLLRREDGALIAALAEVHNTFGDRHCYWCRREDGEPIGEDDWVEAKKRLHVSPFFDRAGGYSFRFSIGEDRIGVWIRYRDGRGAGLNASLVGELAPLDRRALIGACIRRPLGSLRMTALIYMQALRLRLKGLAYRERPAPSERRVS